jgi:hypothetical protein
MHADEIAIIVLAVLDASLCVVIYHLASGPIF